MDLGDIVGHESLTSHIAIDKYLILLKLPPCEWLLAHNSNLFKEVSLCCTLKFSSSMLIVLSIKKEGAYGQTCTQGNHNDDNTDKGIGFSRRFDLIFALLWN